MIKTRAPSYADIQWWEKGRQDRHLIVASILKEIQEQSSYRRQRNLHHLRLYSDRALTSAARKLATASTDDRGFKRPRLSLNVIRSCIDSATSTITRGRPAISYITSEGDFTLQQRAKARSKFVQAVFHQNQAYDIGQRVFKDACILDIGLAKVCREYGKVRIEKTYPGEVWVNEDEAVYGDPPALYQVRAVDAARLKALYPGKAKAIDNADAPESDSYRSRSTIADQRQVIEAWHLPSSPTANDGRHIICTAGGILRDEPYRHQHFPFAEMRWNDESIGWYGCGLAYELTGIQYEINSLLRHIQMGLYSAGGLKILLEKGSKISPTHITNDLWATIVEYVGQRPEWVAPDGISAAVQQMLQFYIEQAYGITGISQLGARGEIPSGLAGSGRAQLVYKDIESQRFITVQRRYEQFFMDLADRVIEAASDLAEDSGEFEATYVGAKYLQRINYRDIGEEDDEFVVQAEPVSMLPYTMAGKFALAEQMRASGYIDINSAKKLSGLPDVDAEMNLELAPIDLVDDAIERILERGEALWPDPRGDVALAVKRATLAFQRAVLNDAPAERLDLLSEYIDEGNNMLKTAEDANKAAAQEALATAGAVGAGPAASAGGDFGAQMGANPVIPQTVAA